MVLLSPAADVTAVGMVLRDVVEKPVLCHLRQQLE
jgi:hypothetical protein